MEFKKTKFKDVFLLTSKPEVDFRGTFTRMFCKKLLAENGIMFNIKQTSLVSNKKKYTLRGLHYQEKPREEQKILFCLKGRIWDVLVDLREDSPSFRKWISFEIDERNNMGLFIPKGFAHGYITLTNEVNILYFMDEFYFPKLNKGINWSDKNININWPYRPKIISLKDQKLPLLKKV